MSEAKTILMHANILATARVDYGAKLSDKGWALNYILSNDQNAQTTFHEVFNGADSIYGRIYGVIGLLETTEPKGESMASLLEQLQKANVKVLVAWNDIIEWVHIKDIVGQLRSDEFRKRMFIVEGKLDPQNLAKVDGASFAELEKSLSEEVGRARAQRSEKKNVP